MLEHDPIRFPCMGMLLFLSSSFPLWLTSLVGLFSAMRASMFANSRSIPATSQVLFFKRCFNFFWSIAFSSSFPVFHLNKKKSFHESNNAFSWFKIIIHHSVPFAFHTIPLALHGQIKSTHTQTRYSKRLRKNC